MGKTRKSVVERPFINAKPFVLQYLCSQAQQLTDESRGLGRGQKTTSVHSFVHPTAFSLSQFISFFVMTLCSVGLNILGLVVVFRAAIATPSHAEQISNCTYIPWQVTASASYNTTITSPNYPSPYDNNLKCAWLIEVDDNLSFRGYIVKVTFNDFSLEKRYVCGDDLTFYDGKNAVSRLLGSYCSKVHPEVIYSTGQHLYVKFYTNSFITSTGFSFSFSAVKKEEASGVCRPWDGSNTVHSLSGSSGTFYSPDYPAPYPKNVGCVWTITVPAGKRVKLKFEVFGLETVFYSCYERSKEKDYVQMRDGKHQESKELAIYCGYNTFESFPEVYSTGRFMWVKFYSTSSIKLRSKGFKARFEAVDLPPTSKELCFPENIYNNQLKLTGSHGTLQSPYFPKYYPSRASCDWLITVPDGKIVKLSFERFKLELSHISRCTADYVEVLDGKHNNSESKGRFCGYKTPDDILSSDRYMWVRFRADPYYPHYEGFKATYTAEEKPMSSTLLIVIVLSVIVFIGLLFCISCAVICKKKPSDATGARIPISNTEASASYTAQPGMSQYSPLPPPGQPLCQPEANPYPRPSVSYAPSPKNPSMEAATSPYPPYPPPPYPGDETVPQYPPPGQTYPWQHNTPAKPASSPESP